MKKKLMSLLMAVALIVSMIPATIVFAASTESCTAALTVEEPWACPGGTVEVNFVIADNPGVLGAALVVSWDESLTLVADASGEAFSYMTYTSPSRYTAAGTNFVWFGNEVDEAPDGVVLTLTFEVPNTAINNEILPIWVTYTPGDVVDKNDNDVTFSITNGYVRVITYLPGDVNCDTRVNSRDLVRLSQYISDGNKTDPEGYNAEVVEDACDVNGDGRVNARDLIRLSQYISDGSQTDPDGYNAILKPAKLPECTHANITETKAKAPSCTEPGNLAYWSCADCGKYFSDENGNTEIALADTMIAASHTLNHINAQAASSVAEGWIEHWKCSVCGKYFANSSATVELSKEDVFIDPITRTESIVVFNVYGSDPYLESIGIDHPKSQTFYSEEGLILNDITNAPAGYEFAGWTTTAGSPITEIAPSSSSRQIVVNANWRKTVYRVTFDTPDVPVKGTKITGEEVVNYTEYTVDTGVTLRSPECYGYTFVGWSNDNGFIVDRINPGTTGHMTLHANWTSNRNKATSYSNYGSPIIIEDDTNGQFLFVYDIGRIDNVPLYTYTDENGNSIGANGTALNIDMTYEVSEQFSTVEAKEVVETVADATTRSSGWTLSEEWNDLYSEGSEYADKQIKSEERTDSQGNVVGGNYFVSNSQGGSSFISTESGGSTATSSKVTTDKSFGINASYDKSTEMYCDATLSAENKTEISAGVEAPVGIAKVSAGVKNTTTIGAEVSNGRKDNSAFHIDGNYSSSVGTVDINDSSSYFNVSANQSSNWNSTTGYEKSYKTSVDTAVSKAIAQEIAKTTNYNISKSLGGGSEHNTAVSGTSSTEKGYSNSLQVSEHYSKTTTKHIKYSNSEVGYYRVVMAGTVHVYGVVGYDVATASYYTYTYNVLADETFEYVDYSKERATFDDCENGVVTFEIPYEVNEYILGVTSETAGLEIGLDGTVNNFEATEDFKGTVVVPQYHAETLPGSDNVALKTKAISSAAFANNTDIKTVILPIYVTEIPDGAFEGCTSLETVIAYGVTKIGKDAFKGCTSLKKFYVDNYITELGTNAFENVPEIAVMAYDSGVADAAIKSGAKEITVDVSKITDSFNDKAVTVDNTTDYFAIVGNGGEYTNLQINSSAKETLISKMTFVNNSDTPIELNSDIATLSVVSVKNSPVYALQLGNDHTDLKLYGEITLSSQGENTVISKNVTLSKANNNITSKLNVAGKYLVCGEVINKESFLNVEPTTITQDEYNIYISPVVITFDANGGVAIAETKIVYKRQKYGDLPTPQREHFEFMGWYTKSENGELIAADSTVNAETNQTLYAQWKQLTSTLIFDANGGFVSESSKLICTGERIGSLPTPVRDHYCFTGWFTSLSGGNEITADSVLTATETVTLYAQWELAPYTVSWDSDVGYVISIERSSSPYANASLGSLDNGATVYYGDVLVVTYEANVGYSLDNQGLTSIVVSGNVTSDSIYATASLNSYTYNIVYESSNGTALGSSSVTHEYNTTNIVDAPAKPGYVTPSSQTVIWDSVTAKTITFVYAPEPVASSQSLASGTWWKYGGQPVLTYSVKAEYRNRTADSVQVRLVWTNKFSGGTLYYGFAQKFYASFWVDGTNVGNTGNVTIASASEWASPSAKARTKTKESNWVTISLNSTAATTINISADYWGEYDTCNGSWSNKPFLIPAY